MNGAYLFIVIRCKSSVFGALFCKWNEMYVCMINIRNDFIDFVDKAHLHANMCDYKWNMHPQAYAHVHVKTFVDNTYKER